MSGFSKNPFGGGSFTSGSQNSASLFGTVSKDGSQSKSSGKI
jgi:hypothetical protein